MANGGGGRPTIATVAAILERLEAEVGHLSDEVRTGFVRMEVWQETVKRIHDRIDGVAKAQDEHQERLAAQEERSSQNRRAIVLAFVTAFLLPIAVALLLQAAK